MMFSTTDASRRNNQSGAARFYRERMDRKARNFRRFVDALADSSIGASIAQVAASVGLSQQTGSVYFREICRSLGGPAINDRCAPDSGCRRCEPSLPIPPGCGVLTAKRTPCTKPSIITLPDGMRLCSAHYGGYLAGAPLAKIEPGVRY